MAVLLNANNKQWKLRASTQWIRTSSEQELD